MGGREGAEREKKIDGVCESKIEGIGIEKRQFTQFETKNLEQTIDLLTVIVLLS